MTKTSVDFLIQCNEITSSIKALTGSPIEPEICNFVRQKIRVYDMNDFNEFVQLR